MRRTLALILSAVLLLAAGCDGDDDAGDDVGIDGGFERGEEAFCDQLTRVGFNPELTVEAGVTDLLALFRPLEATAPAEIEPQLDTIVVSLEDLGDALVEAEASAAEETFQAAAELTDFDPRPFEQALAEVARYASENCEEFDVTVGDEGGGQ